MLDGAKKRRGRKPDKRERLRVWVRGAVQGVGFRPFVYRIAKDLGLTGFINNSAQGVFIEVEGGASKLRKFLLRLSSEPPPRAVIQSLESTYLDTIGYRSFEIKTSSPAGKKTALVLPDIATCPDCLRDISDPANRRYRYPFTNCTNCGPRFSIIRALPYDRANTTIASFTMCAACKAEYEDPADRRFHAQPNACPDCGPQIVLLNGDGETVASRDDALRASAEAVRNGLIIAVKGLGGFHLIVDARNDEAVRELRRRKRREEKPLAVMFPTLQSIEAACEVSDLERRLLTSPEAPIVILKEKAVSGLAHSLAPGNPCLGAMLPYTPLHHLLLSDLVFPVVATSGNLSDEPICIDEDDAATRLDGIADRFLVHDRPIERHVDDSIVRVMAGRELVLRRARGFAPLPVPLKQGSGSAIGVGAHFKNAVAVSVGRNAFVSQHIGDLETEGAFGAFKGVIESLEGLYDVEPQIVVSDKHPDYLSTRWAGRTGHERLLVQHHYAHIMSCMAENELRPPVLGIAWDGTGLGDDGTIWGSEFLRISDDGYERIAHMRPFLLPGGDRAAREPRRSAVGLLYETFGAQVFDMEHLSPVRAFLAGDFRLLRKVLDARLNSPLTTSAGRIFDGVASILDIRHQTRFEGQAAMEVEFAAAENVGASYGYEIDTHDDRAAVIDWRMMVRSILDDLDLHVPKPIIAAKFHNTLIEMMVSIARVAGLSKVALSGGCFQNRYLTERAVTRLEGEGFRVYRHQRVPPNDGGIALGQIAAAAAVKTRAKQRRTEPVCV